MTSTKGRPPTPKELYTAASNPQPLVVIARDARSHSYAALHALKSMGFNLDRAKAPQSSSQQFLGERFGPIKLLECPYGVAARRSGRPLWGRVV